MTASRSVCLADLPAAGLGNLLFVWARARVFSHLNSIPHFTRGWSRPRIGPIFRGERSWRYYGGFFKHSGGSPLPLLQARLLFPRVVEPDLAPVAGLGDRLFVFNQIPHWRAYFASLREHRAFLRTDILDSLKPIHREALDCLRPPVIGVHVRCGDFRPLKPGEDFRKVGLVRTPLEYFKEQIARIRRVHGSELPVTLFSDGNDQELAPLLALPRLTRVERRADIVEMLLLSRSRLIVCSAGSTFSYWAGFLADAPLLLHPDHVYEPLRDAATNRRYFEGGAAVDDRWPELLVANIKEISSA